ncbi:MAG: right-handed parallel beta-helix repeat-containing protein, partial [Pseudomonadota bacterium]
VIVGSSDSAVVQELGAARVENNEIRSVGGDQGDFCVRTSGAGVVTGNSLQLCFGIQVSQGTADGAAENNVIEFPRRRGVDVQSGTDYRVDGNEITGDAVVGVRIRAGASDTEVVNNTIDGSLQDICNDGVGTTFQSNDFTTGGAGEACID